MKKLKQNITPKDIYDYYINQPSTQETFTLFYTRKYKDGIEIKGQKFESKDETYCISLIESIMDSEDFLGWPFGDNKEKITKDIIISDHFQIGPDGAYEATNEVLTIQYQKQLIELYENQIMDLTMMSKIELGDDVIDEIKRLKLLING